MPIFEPIQITRIIPNQWSDESILKIITYWQARGFNFTNTTGEKIEGTRGSLIGNLTSFDMRRLKASLTISKRHNGTIETTMNISTAFQSITEWNVAHWNLEMTTCESYLNFDDLRETEWEDYERARRRAALIWTLTCGIFGTKIPKKHTRGT